MPTIKRFERNTKGRDFVVGDIHGCFRLLESTLAEHAFNESIDRLFCVGDLVDRGPQSAEVLNWLEKPWLFSVMGNHEEMAILYSREALSDSNYLSNGGQWFMYLDKPTQQEIAAHFAELPYLIEVDTSGGRVGIMHADTKLSWSETISRLDAGCEYMQANVLWGRGRISDELADEISGIDVVYAGHTPVSRMSQLGNVRFIDTGACFSGRMTMVCIEG